MEVKPAFAQVIGDEYIAGSLTKPIVGLFYDQSTIDALQARIKELEAEHEQAQRDRVDAARYRLFRQGRKWSAIDWKGDALVNEQLDAAIDAAMEKSNAE